MTPGTKRTILTSKATGRRYFLVRSSNRPNGRRYYVCTNPTCKARVSREADLYCKTHAQEQKSENENIADISTQSDQIDETDIQDNGEIIDEETPTKIRGDTKTDELKANGDHDTTNEEESEEINENLSADSATPLSPNSQSNRQVQVDETTGVRTFRDNSGRRRYLCMQAPCTNMLKRQADLYCRLHASNGTHVNNSRKNRRSQKRHSAPPTSSTQPKKNRFRSPFQTSVPAENGTNGNQSDEYDTPKKTIPQRTGTTRTFRDASGKLRFLCSLPTCHSRVPRQSELYCRRHQTEFQAKEAERNGKDQQSITTNGNVSEGKINHIEAMDVQQNEIDSSSRPIGTQPETKKRKHESPVTRPNNKIILATTTLLDDQWNDVLSFLRQFPQVQLSTNLNVNNSTTHLLVDDSENHLHCTITKKIVQAAVRHHVFIISSRWLNECMRLNTFVDEHFYEIISDSHTTLRLSEQTFISNNRFLFGQASENLYAFAIECRQCQGSINRSELIELIQLTGAQLFQNEQAVENLIVLCDTNDKNLAKIKEKYVHAPASNIKYVTSDFLLKSIIKFEMQDIDKYSL